MPSAPEQQITLPWLVRLRWLTVLGQTVAVVSAHWGLGLAGVGTRARMRIPMGSVQPVVA